GSTRLTIDTELSSALPARSFPTVQFTGPGADFTTPFAPPSPPPEPPSYPGSETASPPTGLQAGDPLAASSPPAPSGFSAPPAAPGALGAPSPEVPQQATVRSEGSIPPPGYTPSTAGYGGGPVPPGAFAPPAAAPVPLGNYQLASWGSRLAAVLIDGLVVLGVAIVGALALGVVLGGLFSLIDGGGVGFTLGAVFGGIIGYFGGLFLQPYWMAKHDGKTLGKQALNIRTIRVNGQPTDLGWSSLRQIVVIWLLINVVGGTFFIPWLLNYLWPLWDAENRAGHDMLVGSRVVKA
ncbi:MAG: RDD family protein, partial [Baekduiaceae bacterium]